MSLSWAVGKYLQKITRDNANHYLEIQFKDLLQQDFIWLALCNLVGEPSSINEGRIFEAIYHTWILISHFYEVLHGKLNKKSIASMQK